MEPKDEDSVRKNDTDLRNSHVINYQQSLTGCGQATHQCIPHALNQSLKAPFRRLSLWWPRCTLAGNQMSWRGRIHKSQRYSKSMMVTQKEWLRLGALRPPFSSSVWPKKIAKGGEGSRDIKRWKCCRGRWSCSLLALLLIP